MSFKKILLVIFISISLTALSGAEKLNEHWTLTLTERFRIETWDNALTLDARADGSRSYTRNRTQLGATWAASPNLLVGLRLANEFRYYLTPGNSDFNLHEVFVDQLYLKLSLPTNQPLTFTLGRQDIMLGEGFIVMDGNPLDGSRSIYFNALRLDWAIRADHQLMAFASYQEEQDDWLPLIHKQDQSLVEQPETGLGIYYTGQWSKSELHGYFVQKWYSDNQAVPFSSSTSTIGGRIKQPILRSIDLSAVVEAGYQLGKRGDTDRRALGGYGYLQYYPVWKNPRFYLPTMFAAGVIYLSGDNSSSDDWEGWDPMFGRWPKWSDSFIYTQIKEDAVAYWTNLISFNGEVRFLLSLGCELRLAYHHLSAPREADYSTGFPGGTGKTRGDLFIGKLSYKFDQHWSGHILGETFDPGDYYFDQADSHAWVRAELMYQY